MKPVTPKVPPAQSSRKIAANGSKKKTATGASLQKMDLLPAEPPAPEALFQSGILAEARTKWQHGVWQELVALDRETISRDPDRAKLALLVGAAHSHLGNMSEARRTVLQALSWGCPEELVARVMLSAVHNSLARTATSLGDNADESHFVAAIQLVEPHADSALLARTRRIRETASIGLLPEALALMEGDLEVARGSAAEDTARLRNMAVELGLLRHELRTVLHRNQLFRTPQRPGDAEDVVKLQGQSPSQLRRDNPALEMSADPKERVLNVYRNLPPSRQANFRYLDVKSLPRTGLHFMRNTFQSILGDSFSFCEWYTEPGCCRQMPCAVTGFATELQDRPLVQMLKSHDFKLTDPAFPTDGPIRRLILIRNPLYLLTSWWALQVIDIRVDLLKAHGIMATKVSFAHDPHVLRAAYRIIDEEGEMPTIQELKDWLKLQTTYIVGFVAKWHQAAQRNPSHTRIVRYQETPHAILNVLDELKDHLGEDVLQKLETFRSQSDSIFVERRSAFDVQSSRISAYMQENFSIFLQAADAIVDQDKTGLMGEVLP